MVVVILTHLSYYIIAQIERNVYDNFAQTPEIRSRIISTNPKNNKPELKNNNNFLTNR